LAAILPFLAGYVLLTGAPPSVVRAAIMAGLYLWGRALQRRPNTWNILAAAAIISVLIDPRSQFTAGFQLSFTAVAAILYLLPRLQASLKETTIGEWLYAGMIRRFATDLALVSISAQLGTMPLQAIYFHVLPVYGLAANLLVVPLAGVAVAAGALALASAPLLGWVGGMFAQTAWLATTGIQFIITWLSTWPLGVVVTGQPGWPLPAGLIVVLLGLPRLFTGERRRRLFYLLAGGLLLANLALWPRVWATPQLRVTVLDVGQWDAIHLSMPGGEQLMIDFGPLTPRFDSGARVVGPYLKGLGITRLDGAAISHPHSDHIGGLPWLLENVPLDTLWDG
jgi:competence protein ComEC